MILKFNNFKLISRCLRSNQKNHNDNVRKLSSQHISRRIKLVQLQKRKLFKCKCDSSVCQMRMRFENDTWSRYCAFVHLIMCKKESSASIKALFITKAGFILGSIFFQPLRAFSIEVLKSSLQEATKNRFVVVIFYEYVNSIEFLIIELHTNTVRELTYVMIFPTQLSAINGWVPMLWLLIPWIHNQQFSRT